MTSYELFFLQKRDEVVAGKRTAGRGNNGFDGMLGMQGVRQKMARTKNL